MREHTGPGFARQHAAVDLDGAGVRDEVHLHTAADDADIHRRRAEQRMHLRRKSRVILLDREDDARGVADRIHAEVRLAAVRRLSAYDDAPAQHALAGDDRTQAARLRDERRIAGEMLAKLHHAAIGKFLIHDRREPDLARRLDAFLMQRGNGVHHRGESGLCVATAAAKDFPICHPRIEWRDAHALHGYRVHVRLHDDAARWIAARQARDHIRAIRKNFLFPDDDAPLLEEFAHPRGDFPFAGTALVGGVHAVDRDEAAERLDDG